ncbi:hypothetical protein DFR29_116115 [Tahibacter aquaticus]|uniref:DUF3034 family protein n=1 Tax=Tahibacter aquaticus TaxID=520092 RepID=A0A4R6YP09_9GAMM|nr:DUF3034 family protein [Tahibacter aquaticus]TDR39413.1 hypothetical protein DFR29_116115 [Tahibacter aquaticus]
MKNYIFGNKCIALLGVLALLATGTATAAGTRQLATGGASTIEGSAGGGIVPWAAITGYGTGDEIGATAFASRVDTGDYRLDSQGAAVGLFNRIELSLARQDLDLITLGPALGLPGAHLRQHVVGVKLRLFGDVIYTDWPQVSLGVQYKKNRDFLIPSVVGATDDSDVDVYLSATKVFLAGVGNFNAFINGTARWTRANETGLLGFGGPLHSGRRLQAEISGGVLLSRHFAIGAEYRRKSGNLSGLPEDDWRDLFIAWFPNRHLSLVLAYVDLGTVATLQDQTGWYLSLQGAF